MKDILPFLLSHSQEIILQRYVMLLAFCTPGEESLSAKCSTLTSDAILISLFRNNAAQLPCPIKGPLEFTYSVNEGECNSPRSRAEACTQDSRLLLRYQACANVHSSESVGQYSCSTVITLLTHGEIISYRWLARSVFENFFDYIFMKKSMALIN